MVRILEAGPLLLAGHPEASSPSSPSFAVLLDEYRGVPFRRVELGMDELAVAHDFARKDITELYPSSEWSRVRRLSKRYIDRMQMHPIVVYNDVPLGWRVLDGCHRLCAATLAGLSAMEAWEALAEPTCAGTDW